MVPDGWQKLTLGNLLKNGEIFDGDWIESKDQDPAGNVRLIQLSDIGDGKFLDKSSRFLTSERANLLKCSYLNPGDILVARMPDPLGRACVFPGVGSSAITAVDVCVIRPPKTIIRDWLLHAVNSNQTRKIIDDLATGTTRTRISRRGLESVEILVPPVSEQIAISDRLSAIDSAIEKTNAVIAQSKRVKQGLLQELLARGIGHTKFKETEIGELPESWKTIQLGSITLESAFGPRFPATQYEECGNFLLLRTTDIDDDSTIDYSGMPGATLDPTMFNRHALQDGDLLITRSGTCGVSTVFESLKASKPVVPGAFLIRFRIDKIQAFPFFCCLAMRSTAWVQQLEKIVAGGVQKNLSGTNLRKLILPLPPVSEQREICSRVGAIDGAIEGSRNLLETLRILKNGIATDLLYGKIRIGGIL